MALTAKKVYAILKRQISDMEAKLNSPVRYRGTIATADLLPLNPDIGDMYNIESKSVYGEAGMNVAWNGVVWDTMGAPIDMSLYLTKEEAEAVIQRLVTEYFEKNPVKPGATTEQALQIEQNKTDIASLKVETGSLKEDLDNSRFYESNGFFRFISSWNNGDVNASGEFVASSTSRRSDKIDVSVYKRIEITTHNHNGCSLREWKANGEYLGSSWIASSESMESRTNKFDFKQDAAYFVLTVSPSANNAANENNIDVKLFTDDYFLSNDTLTTALKTRKGFVSPVTDFGAYGDGSHDDTIALQNCINFCIENKVELKCEKAYTFLLTNTLEFIGVDNTYTTGDNQVVRNFITINAEFDFAGSTIACYGDFSSSLHTATYGGTEIPSALYMRSRNSYDMHFEIKNLFIDLRNINLIGILADELIKSKISNITIKHLSKIGCYVERNCGGIMFYDMLMIANKQKAVGFFVEADDNYFDGIYMVDVTYGMIMSAAYNHISKFHPFILTPSFFFGSVMIKMISRDAQGNYVGESTIILNDCYADTYNIVFDVSSHINHRILSKGLTYINNTVIVNNVLGTDTPSKIICVYTNKQTGFTNRIKLSNNYISGYVKNDIVYTYLCDSEGDSAMIDDMSIISNMKYSDGTLIN